MQKKESTPMREIRRNYEERHKEKRNEQRMTWGTTVYRELGEEINAFLQKNNLAKVDLIMAGYELLKERFDPNSKWNKQ